jgi:hypothetical protein
VPPEQLHPPDHKPRRAEYGHQRDPRLLLSRRYPRELSLDEVEVVGDLREVGAREVDPI